MYKSDLESMDLTHHIMDTLQVPNEDPRLDAFPHGALIVTYCLLHSDDEDFEEHYVTYPFWDERTRAKAYVDASAQLKEVQELPDFFTANLSVTLEPTRYIL